MSERTPLNGIEREYYEIEDEDGYDKPLSTKTKIIFGILGLIVSIGALYMFIIYLPDMFIPKATKLEEISLIKEIDVEFVPMKLQELTKVENQLENQSRKRPVERLLLVGDIHGHYNEFKALLKKMKYNKKTDYLLVLGDFISKGPDSFKVLNFLIDNNIDCIIGNHEYDILNNYADYHRIESPRFNSSTNGVPKYSINSNFNNDPDYLLAKKLKPKHVKYINKCSVIKKLWDRPLETLLGDSYGAGHGIAVHAGIRWDLPLQEQDPIDNIEMRYYLKPYFNETSSEPNENTVGWPRIYNHKQEELNFVNQTVVFYGHNARKGLNLKAFTNGIDTGCDGGNKLTGLVLHLQQLHKDTYLKQEVIQVDC